MKRRTVLAACGALSIHALAQAPRGAHRVAYLNYDMGAGLTFFRETLSELGFVEGRNLQLRSWDVNTVEQLAKAIREILAWQPHAIVTRGLPVTQRVRVAAPNTPVIFHTGADPVASGLVQSLSRPGGNVTGVHTPYISLTSKRLEMARELLPRAQRVGFVVQRGTAHWNESLERLFGEVRRAAGALGFDAREADLADPPTGLVEALERLARAGAEVVLPFSTILDARGYAGPLVEFQRMSRIPVIDDEFRSVEKGVVGAVEEDKKAYYHQLGEVTARVLRGARPAETPVEITSRFQVAINIGAAQSIGLTVPPSIILRADRSIQ